MLGVTLEALVEPGSEVLGILPSFGLYEMFVRRAGGRPRFLAPRADLRLQIDELLAEVRRDASRPVLLCSPNNPTGAAATVAEVGRLLGALDAPLLLDNAYGEFCRHDYRPLLARHHNLVLLRTLSKAWSLAGARVGYLLAHPAIVAELLKVKLPYNLSQAGAVLGQIALEHPRHAERCVGVLRARREQWAAALRGRGLEVFDSEANFLLVRAARAAELRAALAEAGILVRDVGRYPGLGGCLRLTIGTAPALRAILAALDRLEGDRPAVRSPRRGR
jgi:histidinol-phosphate aminotransferase